MKNSGGDCCPKCGGKSGFYFDMRVTHHMIGDWGKHAECGDSGRTTCSLATCIDCKSKMRADTAEGMRGPQA